MYILYLNNTKTLTVNYHNIKPLDLQNYVFKPPINPAQLPGRLLVD